MEEDWWIPFWLSFWAGMSTALGALVVFLFDSSPSPRQMAFVLSVAAGVMISVSVMELWYPIYHESTYDVLIIKIFWSLVGAFIYMALSRFISGDEAHVQDSELLLHASRKESASEGQRAQQWRLAILMMVSLTAHNLPEGTAVAMSAVSSPRVGAIVAMAVALHNIPEGIAIAVPVFAATNSRWQAFKVLE
eukprot:c11788_g1_i1.p1 GENE.c11788_g1_i1~~c11788_g1_i1.p1  ORF type:complete len:203 (-),score=36.09 c11788_g1_i1:362-937(-)